MPRPKPEAGDVLSYEEMCAAESARLQRGMNFQLRGGLSVVLMSQSPNAPYEDRVLEGGRVLIYEGHNAPLSVARFPDSEDQPALLPGGGLTQNGLFHRAAMLYKNGKAQAEHVKVYEKIKPGIWVYNGVFALMDAWQEESGKRKVWRFRLELVEDAQEASHSRAEIEHSRLIPPHVKLEVWKRDKGQCVLCGSEQNLHFDHVIPFSKGGTSLSASNIQLLCLSHNLEKSDKIE